MKIGDRRKCRDLMQKEKPMMALGVEHLRSSVLEKMRGDGSYGPCGANDLGVEQGHSSNCHKKLNRVQMGRWEGAGTPQGLLLVSH